MAAVHPEGSLPAAFSRAVLTYSLREIGWLPPEEVDLDFWGEGLGEAVITIGRAVFTLQVIIRNKLRQLFIESINLVAGVVGEHSCIEVLQFMTQGYLENDIFNTILSNFAIIAELIIFLHDFGIPLASYLYPGIWCNIYVQRLRHDLASQGGWRKLVEETRRRYIDSDFYTETSHYFHNNIPIPYAEVAGANNWPENPLAFLQERFDVVPGSRTLAMNMLRKLYAHKHEMVPPPEQEQLWL